MEFSNLIGGLALTLGVPTLKVDERGYCPLEVDGMSLLLYPEPAGTAVAVIGHVGKIEPTDASRLEALLAANLTQPDGMHMAVDGNRNVMAVQWLPLANMEFTRFTREIERFVNYQEYWCKYMREPAAAPLTMAQTVALSWEN